MEIKQAYEQDLLRLWNEHEKAMSPTTQFFYENIRSGNTLFWTLQNNSQMIGELYVFQSLPDHDFANGVDTAYLCAFRIAKEFRGQGYGTKLLNFVIKELEVQNFKSITIGVDETETDTIRMYKRLGFMEKVKDSCIDPCNMDAQQNPKQCSKFWLLKKNLG